MITDVHEPLAEARGPGDHHAVGAHNLLGDPLGRGQRLELLGRDAGAGREQV